MKETWKDYIAPGILASGLLMLLIGVTVFGSPAHERQINHSYMTTDDSTPSMVTSDEIIEDVVPPPAVVEEEKVPVVKEEASEPATRKARVKTPETRDSYELDDWDDGLYDLVKGKRESYDPDQVLKIIQEQTDLKESDGAFYYYAIAYLHDRFVRNSQTFRKSNYTRAVENYTKAIELDDSVALFHHFRGQVNYYYAMEEIAPEFYEKAIENYKAAAERDPKWPMPVDMQGWTAFRQGKDDEAIQFLEQALEIDPECLDALNCMIQICVKKSNDDPKNVDVIHKGLDTIKRLHTLLKEGKKFGNISYVPGYARQLVDKLAQVEKISPKTHPEYFRARDYLDFVALYLNSTHNYQEALALLEGNKWIGFDYENILFFFPNKPEFERKYLRAYWNFHLGACYYETGNYEKAFEAMTVHYENRRLEDGSMPSHSFVLSSNKTCRYYYFKSAIQLERFQEITDMAKSLNITKFNLVSSIWGEVVYSLFKTGKNEEAMKLIGSDVQDLVRLRGSIENKKIYGGIRDYYLEECYRNAISPSRDSNLWGSRIEQLFETDASLNEQNVQMLKSLAETFVERKDHALAIRFYERYVQYVPTDENALSSLLGEYKLGNIFNEKAFNMASQLVVMSPQNANYWIERACIAFKMSNHGKRSLAVYDLTRAIELLEANNATKDRLQTVYAKRAECYMRDGHQNYALEDYMKILDLVPSNVKPEEIRVETFEHEQGIDFFALIINCMDLSYHSPSSKDNIIKSCTELMQRGGDECLLLERRGQSYFKSGQYRKALDDFLIVLQFESSQKSSIPRERTLASIGQCYSNLHYLDQGIEYLTLAIEENPNNRNTYLARANVYTLKSIPTDEKQEYYRELAKQDKEKANELQKNQR